VKSFKFIPELTNTWTIINVEINAMAVIFIEVKDSVVAFVTFANDFLCTSTATKAAIANIVPGEYNSSQSESISATPKISVQVKSINRSEEHTSELQSR